MIHLLIQINYFVPFSSVSSKYSISNALLRQPIIGCLDFLRRFTKCHVSNWISREFGLESHVMQSSPAS